MTDIGRLPPKDRPGLATWAVADLAARDALTHIDPATTKLPIVADDIGRICRVGNAAPFAYFELIGVNPLAWAALGGGALAGAGGSGARNYAVSFSAREARNVIGQQVLAATVIPDLPGTFTIDPSLDSALSFFIQYSSSSFEYSSGLLLLVNGQIPVARLFGEEINIFSPEPIELVAGDTLSLVAVTQDSGFGPALDGQTVMYGGIYAVVNMAYDESGVVEGAHLEPIRATEYPINYVYYATIPDPQMDSLGKVSVTAPNYAGILPADADGNAESVSINLALYEVGVPASGDTPAQPGQLIQSSVEAMSFDASKGQNIASMELNNAVNFSGGGRDLILAIDCANYVYLDSTNQGGYRLASNYNANANFPDFDADRAEVIAPRIVVTVEPGNTSSGGGNDGGGLVLS